MCGRFTLATPADDLVEAFDVGALTFDYFARFNLSPGQACPVVAEDKRGRRIGLLHWGLVPSWRDEPGSGFINARAESVATKPSFRDAFRRRRCLIPADGFYEWKRGGEVTPFWIHPVGGGLVSFAGIWETWRRPEGSSHHGFAIITTAANTDVREIHDRMPVVIAAGDRTGWLSRTTSVKEAGTLLRPAPDGTLAHHEVSRRVNSTAEDDAALIDPGGGITTSP